MTLVRAIGFHWHALQRDLLALGFRAVDMFTPKLTAGELISIITASPPGSAVHHAFNPWTLTEHLLATMSEQQGGLVQLQGRHERPGVSAARQQLRKVAPVGNMMFDVMPLDKFKAQNPHG